MSWRRTGMERSSRGSLVQWKIPICVSEWKKWSEVSGVDEVCLLEYEL